jgi:uncharacterized membrane protein YeaQ/YmgE (transglycosylase-associated protein family)
MAVLGWIALGLVTALFASGFQLGEEGRVFVVRCLTAMAGGLVGGLVAVAAGVGPIDDFFHTGTWLCGFGGAVLALFVHELARPSHRRHEGAEPGVRSWAARRAGGESEELDRNW